MPVPQISVFVVFRGKKQAGCLFHKYLFLLYLEERNRQDAYSTNICFVVFRGKKQAGCLFHKYLFLLYLEERNRQDAYSTNICFCCI
jgi:hypothetical protein